MLLPRRAHAASVTDGAGRSVAVPARLKSGGPGAVQAARHGNLWIDTSSARSILPGLIEWAVREVGADRLMFGSDTPLYHVAMQRARIETAEIPESAKALILRENAWNFFGLSRSASLNPVST